MGEEYEERLATYKDEALAPDPDEHRFHTPKKNYWRDVRKHTTHIGELYTPKMAVRLIVEILHPAEGMDIYDATCSSDRRTSHLRLSVTP